MYSLSLFPLLQRNAKGLSYVTLSVPHMGFDSNRFLDISQKNCMVSIRNFKVFSKDGSRNRTTVGTLQLPSKATRRPNGS